MKITMYRRSLILLLIAIAHSVGYAQKYQPTILILNPRTTTTDGSAVDQEVKQANDQIKKDRKKMIEAARQESREIDSMAENVLLMQQKKIEFVKTMTFYSHVAAVSEGYLQSRFYERFPQLMIYAIDESSIGDLAELSSLGRTHGMQYVLNFPKIHSFMDQGVKKSTITVQLYDTQEKEVLLKKDFTGNADNPGFEFACEDNSLECTLNNALSSALSEIIQIVASRDPTIIRDRQLAQERSDYLFSSVYPQPVDRNINIITDDLQDLDKVPSIYAYVVIGIQHEGEWFIQKSNVTYFNAQSLEDGRREYFNNLQRWGYFAAGSAENDNSFWERNFFSKIGSSVEENQDEIQELQKLKARANKPEDKKLYQSMIDRHYADDLKNKEYFGMYNLVADKLREHNKELREEFDRRLGEEILTPFFQDIIQNSDAVDYKKFSGNRFTTIYPRNRRVILCPMVLAFEKRPSELQYFVLIPTDQGKYAFYRWTYFKPVSPKNISMYGVDINEQMNTVTTWNFSFDYLDDPNFWEEYVLKKNDNGEFKYLQTL